MHYKAHWIVAYHWYGIKEPQLVSIIQDPGKSTEQSGHLFQ